MNLKIKKLVVPALALSVFMTGILSACSSNKPENSPVPTAAPTVASNKTPDPVSLKIMLFGDKSPDLDKVLAKFEETTKDTLNTKLEFEYNPVPDHKQKVLLKMSTGEQVDLLFDAPWQQLNNNISLGYYQQLDKYFNNDEYPGLKNAFPSEIIEANKINGHIYTIPFMTAYYDPNNIGVRKVVREEVGAAPVKNLDDLKAYYEKVLEKKPGYVPLALGGGRGFFKMFVPEEKGHNDIRLASILQDSFTGGIPFSVALSPDGKKVIGAATLGDPNTEFAKFPTPFNTHDSIYGHFGTRVEWKKYTNKDPLSGAAVQALDPLKNGSGEGVLSGVTRGKNDIKALVPNDDMEMFLYQSQDIRDMKPGALRTDYRSNNSVVIPTSSQNADRTMKFLDWLFSSKENHDLFELGIEGEHWIKDGDNGYKTTTWNPLLSRVNTAQDEETLKYIAYTKDESSYYQIPLSGFIFDTKPVATEIGKITPVLQPASDILMNGLEPKWQDFAQKLNKDMRNLGLENIRAEVIKQVQAYLDAGGK
ncbi:extracellular solute-binding protein [Paenibacillus sp. Soil522]|uniref:extracellular solute-binding protein n=1 Tax=Paenibacillus sp. Soil522 TaxID=1736388 RepID=UPI0006F77584|nr:extracellular solute-binding protein [Paenibacillus sp. Soil522]KRE32651.1 hypothetical protein ASG81_24295 [Paenibacillus sp. Soil522]